jgi:hypothetical protein
MGVVFWSALMSPWHFAQAASPAYSFAAGSPLVGHQPGPAILSSVVKLVFKTSSLARAKQIVAAAIASTKRESRVIGFINIQAIAP